MLPSITSEPFANGLGGSGQLDSGNIPISVLQGTSSTPYVIHSDHLNTPRQIEDSNGLVVWYWDTLTFGGAQPNTNPMGLGTFNYNLRFSGQYYDQESGLFQNHFRDYYPNLGRYIESDPIGLGGGLNRFTYVSSNPLSYSDPMGLCDVYFETKKLDGPSALISACHAYVLTENPVDPPFKPSIREFRGGPQNSTFGNWGPLEATTENYIAPYTDPFGHSNAGAVDYQEQPNTSTLVYHDNDSCNAINNILMKELQAINSANLRYNPLTGPNSNSAANGFLNSINVGIPDLNVNLPGLHEPLKK